MECGDLSLWSAVTCHRFVNLRPVAAVCEGTVISQLRQSWQAQLISRRIEIGMANEIRQTDSLTEVEKRELFDWGDDIFGVSSLNLRWRPKDVHFVLYIDDKPISHVGLLRHAVSVNGEAVAVGGVAGVVTVPEAQKRGHARQLMQHAASFLKEWNVDAGLLFCLKRLIPYYEALGWRVVEQPVEIEQPQGVIISPLEVMVLPFGGRSWPDGKVTLNSFPW